MVCGFGDSVAYDTLACAASGSAQIDKSSRFTDWARRPLTERQVGYALADVIHLRPIYDKLRLRWSRRMAGATGLGEEMAILTDRATYEVQARGDVAAPQTAQPETAHGRDLARGRGLARTRSAGPRRPPEPDHS